MSPPPPTATGILTSTADPISLCAPSHLPLQVATPHGEATVSLPPSPSDRASAPPSPAAILVSRAEAAGGAACVDALRQSGAAAVVALYPRRGRGRRGVLPGCGDAELAARVAAAVGSAAAAGAAGESDSALPPDVRRRLAVERECAENKGMQFCAVLVFEKGEGEETSGDVPEAEVLTALLAGMGASAAEADGGGSGGGLIGVAASGTGAAVSDEAAVGESDPFDDPPKKRVDTIVSARWVIPMEPDETVVLHYHSVVVDGGKVVAVLPTRDVDASYTAGEVLERPSSVVIPGLINAHTHTGMSLMRGAADDEPLMKWLQETVWPVETAFVSTDGFCEDGARLAAAEMARGGVTTFCDMYWFPEAAADAVLDVGLRAALGMIVIMFPSGYAGNTGEYFGKGHTARDRYADKSTLHWMYAPHAPYTVKDEVWEKLRDLSAESGTIIHTHMHETADECVASAALDRDNPACHQSDSACRPLENFRRMGLLSPRLLCVHMTQLTDEEIAMLAEYRVNIVHCPASNAKLASGFCQVHKLLAAGVNVALGTDSAASNNSLDLFGEMRLAALVAKQVAGDATVLPAPMALRMATRNGAEALGIGDVTGSLLPGKAADLVCVEMESHAGNTPVFDVRSALVYAAARTDVTDVLVEGKTVVRDGNVITVDEQDIVRRAREWAERINKKFPRKNEAVDGDVFPPPTSDM